MEDNKYFPTKISAKELDASVTSNLKQAILLKKELDNNYKNFSDKLLESMEANGVYSYKDDNVTISYLAESETLSLNTKMLQEKYPKVYEDCLEIAKKKASVRILVHKDKNKKE